MPLVVREFVAANDRNRVKLGDPFEVALECGWEPLDQSGSQSVSLSCEQGGFSVAPHRIEVGVDADGAVTTKRFKVAVSGPRDEMVDVIATAPSGSTDSFLIKVVRQ